jgi:hypothetical protein
MSWQMRKPVYTGYKFHAFQQSDSPYHFIGAAAMHSNKARRELGVRAYGFLYTVIPSPALLLLLLLQTTWWIC